MYILKGNLLKRSGCYRSFGILTIYQQLMNHFRKLVIRSHRLVWVKDISYQNTQNLSNSLSLDIAITKINIERANVEKPLYGHPNVVE